MPIVALVESAPILNRGIDDAAIPATVLGGAASRGDPSMACGFPTTPLGNDGMYKFKRAQSRRLLLALSTALIFPMSRREKGQPFVEIGWREWIALPELGIPAIKVKTDTGARTSALHTFSIDPFFEGGVKHVRFGVHPIQRRKDIEVYCSAPVVDRRQVTSTSGQREKRFVIETPLKIGDWQWPIEITLASRENLNFRMLLGRKALGKRALIYPGRSYLQGKPGSLRALLAAYETQLLKERL